MDLNDLRYFAAIVDAGSLSGASRHLGVTKSLLSQHLARLEHGLGVCLIQRTTRRLQVTPIGQEFHQHCLAVLVEVERARSLIDDARAEPRGVLKVSCPVLFAQLILAPLLTSFLQRFPEIELVLDADYRDVDIIGEGYDVALRIQHQLADSSSVVRSFALDQHWLVASPDLARQLGMPRTLADLEGVPGLSARGASETSGVWALYDAQDAVHRVSYRPRMAASDLLVLKHAALAGLGVALLPAVICTQDVAAGQLLRLLPGHHGGTMYLHAVYPSRQGLSRAARCFLEHLGATIPPCIQDAREHGLDQAAIPTPARQPALA